MKIVVILLLAAVLGAATAHAFTVDRSSDSNPDGSARFSDPDDQLDEMTDAGSSAHPGGIGFGSGNGVQSFFGVYPDGQPSDRTTSAIR